MVIDFFIDVFFFFFNDTATTEIYTLSLHDALPIFRAITWSCPFLALRDGRFWGQRDRKSTRLNSSHSSISYAVFCLKKKKNVHHRNPIRCHIIKEHPLIASSRIIIVDIVIVCKSDVIFLNFLALEQCSLFFFNDTATTEIYTLSLHDALPI